MRAELENIGRFLVEQLTLELIRQDHKASGKLIQGLGYHVLQDSTGWELVVTSQEDYAQYVELGRRQGKMPPVQVIIDWVRRKGLETGEKQIVNAAWAISKGIAKNGTRAEFQGINKRNFIENTINDTRRSVNEQISAASVKNAEIIIRNIIKESRING